MNHIRKRNLFCIITVVVLLLFLSFSNETYAKDTKEVKLNHTKVTLVKGTSTTLSVQGTKKKTKWKTANSKIATVNQKGRVIAKKAGRTSVKAKVGSKTLTCKITVINYGLNKTKLTLSEGQSTKLKLLNAKKKVKWSSKNKKIATVDKKGKVTAKSSGRTTIYAQMNGKKYKCSVTVKKKKTDIPETADNSEPETPKQPETKPVVDEQKPETEPKPPVTGTVTGEYVQAVYTDNIVDTDEISTDAFQFVTSDSIDGMCFMLDDTDAVSDVVREVQEKQSKGKSAVIIIPDKGNNNMHALAVTKIVPLEDKYLVVGREPLLEEVFDKVQISYENQVDFDGMEWNDEYVKETATVSANSMKELLSVSGNSAEDELAQESISGRIDKGLDVGEGLEIQLCDQKFAEDAGQLSGKIVLTAPHIDVHADIDTQNMDDAKIDLQITETVITSFEMVCGKDVSIYLGHKLIPIENGFSVNIVFNLVIDAQGQATIQNTTTFSCGITYADKEFTPSHSVNTSFEGTQADICAEVLVNPSINLQWLGVWSDANQEMIYDIEIVGINVFGGIGADANIKFHDKKPITCCEVKIYPVFKLGLNCEYGIGAIIKKINNDNSIGNIEILNKDSDTALTKKIHIEDSVVVPKCTHGEEENEENESEEPGSGNGAVEITWPTPPFWSGSFESQVGMHFDDEPVFGGSFTAEKNGILTVYTSLADESTVAPFYKIEDKDRNQIVDGLGEYEHFFINAGNYYVPFYVDDGLMNIPGESLYPAYKFSTNLYFDELDDAFQYTCPTMEEAKKAEAIVLNATYAGMLSITQPQNYYKIKLEHSGVLRFTDQSKDKDLEFLLFDEHGCQMNCSDDWDWVFKSGEYYLCIKNQNKKYLGDMYAFSISFSPALETYTYNHTTIEETSLQDSIPFDSDIQGISYYNFCDEIVSDDNEMTVYRDTQFYKMTINKKSHILLLHDATRTDYEDWYIGDTITLYDSNKTLCFFDELSPSAQIAELEAGTYYIGICREYYNDAENLTSKDRVNNLTYHFKVLAY